MWEEEEKNSIAKERERKKSPGRNRGEVGKAREGQEHHCFAEASWKVRRGAKAEAAHLPELQNTREGLKNAALAQVQ